MTTITQEKTITKEKKDIKQLQLKADIFDELMEMIEDRYLGSLMESVENERNIPFFKAKQLMK